VLAAVLLVFTGSAIISLATRRSDAVLAAQLTADHTRCFRAFVATDSPPGLDAREVEAELTARYGWHLHVPPSSSADGVQLIHARRCLYADGRVAHLLYRVNGQDVSLFALEGVARKAADVAAFGHRSRIWTRDDTTFVLVSPSEGRALDSAVRYVMQEAH
jgi:anti-sigma factor RsiW